MGQLNEIKRLANLRDAACSKPDVYEECEAVVYFGLDKL